MQEQPSPPNSFSDDDWRVSRDTESGSENDTFSFGPFDKTDGESDEDAENNSGDPKQSSASAKFLQHASRYKGFSPEAHREMVKEHYVSFSQNREAKKIKQTAFSKLRNLTPREFTILKEAHKVKVREANNEARRRQKEEIKKKRHTLTGSPKKELSRAKSEPGLKDGGVKRKPKGSIGSDSTAGEDGSDGGSATRGRVDSIADRSNSENDEKESGDSKKSSKKEKKEREKREKKEKKERERKEKGEKRGSKSGKPPKDSESPRGVSFHETKDNGNGDSNAKNEGNGEKEVEEAGKGDKNGIKDGKPKRTRRGSDGDARGGSDENEDEATAKGYQSSDDSKKQKIKKAPKPPDNKDPDSPAAPPKFDADDLLESLYNLCTTADKEVTFDTKLRFLDEVIKEFEAEKQAMKAKGKSGLKGRGTSIWEDSSLIFHKPLASLSCHQDFARLLRNWQIAKKVGTRRTALCGPFKGTAAKTECAATLLITLANTLGEEEMAKMIDKNFGKYITCDDDLLDPTGLKSMFSDLIGETNIVVCVLKATTQGIVAPAITKFKEALEPLTFNSARGGWGIGITVGQEDITVLHKKKERASPEAEERYGAFTFEWAIEYTFDVNMLELKYVRPFLLSVKGGAKMKKTLTKAFKTFAEAK